MITLRDRFLDSVRIPPSTKEAKDLAARFVIVQSVDGDSKDLQEYDQSQDYFRLMLYDVVEPTNSHNEQQIRCCVIDR